MESFNFLIIRLAIVVLLAVVKKLVRIFCNSFLAITVSDDEGHSKLCQGLNKGDFNSTNRQAQARSGQRAYLGQC